jgi:quercetin dioxygenase-like cupin family protein
MVRIYRVKDSLEAKRAGYLVKYVADVDFRDPLDSCGLILVYLEKNGKSSPHAHELLDEIFIALTDIRIFVDGARYDLKEGDVVVVEPGEAHSFETKTDKIGRILALKFPNIKDDKIVPARGNEN